MFEGDNDMFLVGHVPGLVKSYNTGIFWDTMNVTIVKHVLHIALYLFIHTFSDLDIISRSQLCQIVLTENFMFLSD